MRYLFGYDFSINSIQADRIVRADLLENEVLCLFLYSEIQLCHKVYMDFQFNQEEAAFYEEVEEFLKQTLPEDWSKRSFHWPGGCGTGELQSDESKKIALQYRRKLIEKGGSVCLKY